MAVFFGQADSLPCVKRFIVRPIVLSSRLMPWGSNCRRVGSILSGKSVVGAYASAAHRQITVQIRSLRPEGLLAHLRSKVRLMRPYHIAFQTLPNLAASVDL